MNEIVRLSAFFNAMCPSSILPFFPGCLLADKTIKTLEYSKAIFSRVQKTAKINSF